MPINNQPSNAPANMQPWVRQVEDRLDKIEAALLTLGVRI